MAENRSRFVLLCQQTLAIAVVTAVAAPAANMVSLDIVAPPQPQATGSAAAPGATATSVVDTTPVEPVVSTVPLVGVSKAGVRALDQRRALRHTPSAGAGSASGSDAKLVSSDTTEKADATDPADLTVLSAPQPVDGLATVGVTWASGVHVPDLAIHIAVRTKRAGIWSTWTALPYHDDEGPDPTSTEGQAASPGTDPVYVGEVDDVQIKALTDSGRAPAGMKLALVDPGTDQAVQREKPALDTGRMQSTAPGSSAAGTSTAGGSSASLSAARVTSKPRIYSRAQWGADERMRDKASLHYGEVHAGFVHHTVNANAYTRAQVPALIRGIYAYHTQSRGWSDVGYNFLVDRFGRIWEGRAGGVARPVVGAHTLGYNDDAFAMSAIGNFDIARPPAVMVDAFGRLFAWKLSLHGVRASSTRQYVTNRYLQAIDGHRDVGQTACPGRYLYAQIPTIRKLAAGYQRSFAARDRSARVAGTDRPALVVRDRASKRVYLIRTSVAGKAGRVTRAGISFVSADRLINAGDWNGDGYGDVITRSGKTGLLYLHRGTSDGRLVGSTRMSSYSFAHVGLLAATGDMTGDGRPDLMGQPSGGNMRIYPGNGAAGFTRGYIAHSGISATQHLGVGLWDSDGAPDSVLRGTNGALTLYPGNGPGGLTGGWRAGSVRSRLDWLIAVGDLNGDGRADLVGRARATGKLWLLPSRATGFASRRLFGTGAGRFDLAG
jgi:N-acetylmuramoyl-L-alanine amidase/FG-GAP-like repeat